jgi:hypothetical protein
VEAAATERVGERIVAHASFDRVQVHVTNEYEEVCPTVNRNGLESAADEWAVPTSGSVELTSVPALQPAHRGRETAVDALHDEVVVRVHQAEAMDPDAAGSNGAGEQGEEAHLVGWQLEEGPARQAAVHDMVKLAGCVAARSSGHADLRGSTAR